MKGKWAIWFVLLALVIVSMTFVAACAKEATPSPTSTPSPIPKVYKLKVQSAWPHGDLSMETLTEFAAAAEKRSNGRLKISVFGEPDIVPMFQVLEAVKKGTLDIGHAGGTLWGGVIPVGEIEFGIPYGFRVAWEKTYEAKQAAIRKFFYESGFIDLLREEYAKQGVYYLDIHTYGPVPIVVAKKPIRTMEDLKGVKIRDEGLWTEWHNMLGAAGTDISGSEAYMALKTGALDAAQWDVSCITGLKWHEVAPYWIRGEENDACIGHMLVNMDVWNSLPDDLKEALAGAAEDYWYATVEAYGKEVKVIEDMAKRGEITEVWLDDEAIAKHAEAAHKLWDKLAAKDAACAKAIQLIKEWQEEGKYR